MDEIDGRNLPPVVMDHLRKIAVRAVLLQGYSPEDVIEILGLSRSCIYTWLGRYRAGGIKGLERRKAPGAPVAITQKMDEWLWQTVTGSTPLDHGYDTPLWTRDILAELLDKRFGISVSGRTVSLHLRRMGLSYQKPRYRGRASKIRKSSRSFWR